MRWYIHLIYKIFKSFKKYFYTFEYNTRIVKTKSYYYNLHKEIIKGWMYDMYVVDNVGKLLSIKKKKSLYIYEQWLL